MKFRKAFAYAGGQKNLLPILKELIPAHKTYVEVFSGGLTLLFNKQPSELEVANDINRKLVNLFIVLRDEPDEFRRQLALLPNSRDLFNMFRKGVAKEEDPIKRAVMYYYIIQNTWSGKTHNPTYVAKSAIHKIDEVEWFSNRMRSVIIENLDFQKVIEKYDSDDTFFFLDPPYVNITDLYEFSFKTADHVRLASTLKSIKGEYLVTYGKHPLVDLLYRSKEGEDEDKRIYLLDYETPMTMSRVKNRKEEMHTLAASYDIVDRKFKPFTARYFKL